MTGYSLTLLNAQIEEARDAAATAGLDPKEVAALLRAHADDLETNGLDPDAVVEPPAASPPELTAD